MPFMHWALYKSYVNKFSIISQKYKTLIKKRSDRFKIQIKSRILLFGNVLK